MRYKREIDIEGELVKDDNLKYEYCTVEAALC